LSHLYWHRGLPRTSNRHVEELRVLLREANLPSPYILCGHSYGGLNMRLFASLYPEEVSALVLVEAFNNDTFPDDTPVSSPVAIVSFARNTAFLGTPRLLARLMYPPAIAPKGMRMELHGRTKECEALYQDWKGMENWREVRRMMRPLGNKPVTVITGDEHEVFPDWWPEAQAALAKSVSDDVEWLHLDCGHMVNAERPKAIISATRRIIERIPTE
jgi:pimeloyl-ACP methyl ester carboxylesterase